MAIPEDLTLTNLYPDETETAVRDRMLAEVDSDFNKQPGDIVYDMIAPAASEIARFYAAFNGWIYGIFPSTATGTNLDAVAAFWGISRTTGETDRRLRRRLLGRMESPLGGGSIGDWESWVAGYPALTIDFVRVFPTADGPGTVTVVVGKETAGVKAPLSGPELTALETYLADYTPAGAVLTLETITTNALNVTITAEVLPGFNSTATEDAIMEAIRDWMRDVPIGGELVRFELIQRVMEVPGVYDLTTATIAAGTTNVSLTALQAAIESSFVVTLTDYTP